MLGRQITIAPTPRHDTHFGPPRPPMTHIWSTSPTNNRRADKPRKRRRRKGGLSPRVLFLQHRIVAPSNRDRRDQDLALVIGILNPITAANA